MYGCLTSRGQRIDRIKSTLSSDLDHLFAGTLASITSSNRDRDGKTVELDKGKWIADVTECLRTYDVLGLWHDAEDVLRREVVRDFIKKVCLLPCAPRTN